MNHPKLGVCYYPEHWPRDKWAADAQKMRMMGLSLVRIGEFAWHQLEPQEGVFHWNWLDEAIETLGTADLEVILGTPTATPPRWVLNKYPDMLPYDRSGRPRSFGSRRHYCFSHQGYRQEAAKIAGLLAQRYARATPVSAWQIDNEYGCHDTTLSFSPSARQSFTQWLAHKYTSIDELNDRWGNVFWSMSYDSFESIPLPNLTVTEANPAHWMDFYRFSSDQVVQFNRAQIIAIRTYCHKPLIHNYMGRITDFDHFDIGVELEIASWDSYPIGFLEDRSDRSSATKKTFLRQGDPDFQAFHHDLYRGVGKGRWGVMEQQPGPVNWAPHNPAPLPGMVRLWAWEAIAHGAEFVNFFRWRQVPFGQEQMHTGLERSDGQNSPAIKEVERVAQELKTLTGRAEIQKSDIALVFDYPSNWAWDIEPQGAEFSYFRLVFDFYQSLRRLGQNIDFINAQDPDLKDRKLIIIPGLFCASDTLIKALHGFDGYSILGPRFSSKTEDFQIPGDIGVFRPGAHTAPSLLGFDLKIEAVESLPAGAKIPLADKGAFQFWREFVQTTEFVLHSTDDGYPAVIQNDKLSYLCGWPDAALCDYLLAHQLTRIGLPIERLPDGLRRREFGAYTFYQNYTAEDITHKGFLISGADLRLIKTDTQVQII